MNKDRNFVNAVLAKAQESKGKKKLTCSEAFELAKRFNVEVIEIGRVCNQRKVRICKCQLGCFS
jgi:hypothetical protein